MWILKMRKDNQRGFTLSLITFSVALSFFFSGYLPKALPGDETSADAHGLWRRNNRFDGSWLRAAECGAAGSESA
jgi:hypothetical protein